MTLICGRVNFFSGPHLVFKYWLRGKFMRIIIVGCGKVGSSIASELNLEGHEISVVDINHGAVDKLANSLDVLGIEGNGATYDVLIEAGAEYADLLIAATARDETICIRVLWLRRQALPTQLQECVIPNTQTTFTESKSISVFLWQSILNRPPLMKSVVC